MVRGQGHNPIEPFPEGKVPVRKRFSAELRPGDDQVLEIIPVEVWVSKCLGGQVEHVVLGETSVSVAGTGPLHVESHRHLVP